MGAADPAFESSVHHLARGSAQFSAVCMRQWFAAVVQIRPTLISPVRLV